EDASKQGRKIDDIDKDVEITLVDETQGSTANPVTTAGEVVTTASVEISTASPTKTIIADDLTLAQTLIEIKSAKPKVKGVVIGEQSESITRTRPQQLPSKDKVELEEEDRLVRQREEEANIVSWDNVQAMIDADYQMAQQMQAKEQEKLSIEEKSKLFVQLLEARKKQFAAMRAKEMRNKPPTKAQKRNTMSTYLKNIGGYKHNQLKNKIFDDIQKLFDKSMKRVNTFVDMDTKMVEGSEKRAGEELMQESAKKQNVDDDKETKELKSIMKVMPDKEEVALDAIPLAIKSTSIVDWKIHKKGKKTYYQIIKADGSSKMYLVFSHILKSFDREDLETLYKLVKAKYGSTRPVEDLDLVLYGDLKTMFKPYVEDNVWKNKSDYRVLDRKLYDSRGVHLLRKQNGRIVGIKRLLDDLGVTTAKILDSNGAIPTKTTADAKIVIQEMAEYSHKWHNGTSLKTKSTKTSNGLATIQAQLNNLGREIKKVNEKVYAAQVRSELWKGPHYTKDFLLKEEGNTLEEAYYTQFGAPYQPAGQYRAAEPGFYQRNNRNSSYPDRR
ncbi:hypothetical protein Tco_0782737, partial [Tanacetum coccineum]